MPRVCTVCTHPDRDLIDRQLVAGRPSLRAIADQHDVSRGALTRHRDQDHLPQLVHDEVAEAEGERALSLVEELDDLNRTTRAILHAALSGQLGADDVIGQKELVPVMDDGRLVGFALPGVALRAVAELRRNLELLGKLEGELPDGGDLEVVVTYTEDWRTGG